MPRKKSTEDHPYTLLAANWVSAGIDPRPFFSKAGIDPEFFFPPQVRELLGTSRPIDASAPVVLPGPDSPPLVLLTKAEQRKIDQEKRKKLKTEQLQSFDVILANPPCSL